MASQLDEARLLAVIETQNEIAALALDLESVMAFVSERACELTRAGAAVIEVVEGDEMVYRVAMGTAGEHVGLRLKVDSSLSGMCARAGRVLRCDDAREDPRVDGPAAERIGALSMICVPLRHGGEVAGVLKVCDAAPNHFDSADVAVLGLLSGVIAAHMAHASDYEVVQRQSRQDVLTGLGNRRAFEEDLAAAIRFALRKDRTLALALVDIDHFKKINDQHGHPGGDAVLVALADVLRRGRAGDKAYRIGGDEFALVMPETHGEGAQTTVDRVVRAVGDGGLAGIPVSVSAGYAERGNGGADDIYAAADAALYEAKAQRQ